MTANHPQYARYPSLKGRKVLVTGGATGIGEAFVSGFAAQDAQVAFFDIQDQPAEALVQRLRGEGHPAPLYRRCDLTDTAAAQQAVSEVIHQLGGLDVLVNNAANDQRHSVESVTPELWDRLLAVNLRHQFFVTQAALPALKASGTASVINMSSIAWLIPGVNMPVYITAKAAIVGLTKTLAHELGKDRVRVNCILPGAIVTEKQERTVLTEEFKAEVMANQAIKRFLVPADVVRLALFLASDDASAITAQGHIVDGGWV